MVLGLLSKADEDVMFYRPAFPLDATMQQPSLYVGSHLKDMREDLWNCIRKWQEGLDVFEVGGGRGILTVVNGRLSFIVIHF